MSYSKAMAGGQQTLLCPILRECMQGDEQYEHRVILLKLQQYLEETKCPICHGMLKAPRLVKACMHRFCKDCITRAISDRQKCPVCKAHLGSHRETMEDTRMQKLLEALFGDPLAFESQLEKLNQCQTDVLAQAMIMQKQRERALREQAKLLWAESNGNTKNKTPEKSGKRQSSRKSVNAHKIEQNGTLEQLNTQKRKGSLSNLLSRTGKSGEHSANGNQSAQKRKQQLENSASSSEEPLLKKVRQGEEDGQKLHIQNGNQGKKGEEKGIKGLPPLKLPQKLFSSKQSTPKETERANLASNNGSKANKKQIHQQQEDTQTPLTRGQTRAMGGRARSGVPKTKSPCQESPVQSPKENVQQAENPSINNVGFQMSEEANMQQFYRVSQLLNKQKEIDLLNRERARICVKLQPRNNDQLNVLDCQYLYCPLETALSDIGQLIKDKLKCKNGLSFYVENADGYTQIQQNKQLERMYLDQFEWQDDLVLFYDQKSDQTQS
eukprot:TRINITY_DN13722_c0_g2_i2.p1 TRINITY_DN13722_c0_g2~~TRINITY_DN13722_c0_g2_i2.p1  ORF type:complete len:495 (+),score=50.08 TRINITY_DN13722_c0_g2_i2:167-1651(+)